MKKFLLATVALALIPTTSDAKRTKVRIYKPSAPVQQPADVALVAIPPAAVAFDLIRRTSCDPRIAVSTGPGDPGFDPKGPKTGNFLIPAIYRRECAAQPRR
jgi:hypothetical protein